MKRLVAVIASSLFAGGVNAAGIYYGLGDGNSDLSTQRLSAQDFAGVQPSVGDTVNRYQGWEDGNPDLFKTDRSGPAYSGDEPNIYRGISGNPDLEFWGP